jgi:hypothetical protein
METLAKPRIRVTMNIYTHATPSLKRDLAQRMGCAIVQKVALFFYLGGAKATKE